MPDSIESQAGAAWLLLIHSLPPKPDYLRVKVRRRLERIGALPLKSSVYVLPATPDAREDFTWLLEEIRSEGGEAFVCEARFIAATTDLGLIDREVADSERSAAIEEVPRGSTWVTRAGVKVDRIASAWLIRRSIDPAARFRFLREGERPAAKELSFDLYGGRYTHEGNRCTFETLLHRFGLTDPALAVIGEIVHDIDLKTADFGRAEAAGIALAIDGLVQRRAADADRLERGAELFDDLYARLSAGE